MSSAKTHDQSWWIPYEARGMFPKSYYEFICLEDAAVTIRQVSSNVVPGLLQTEQYMRSFRAGFPSYIQEDRVQVRLERQWHILERANPPRAHVVIDQAALCRTASNLQVMYEQIIHLIRLAKQPNITIQVYPFEAKWSWLMAAGCITASILGFAGKRPNVVCVEDYIGEHHISDNAHESMAYNSEFVVLTDQILTPEESIRKMQDMADSFLRQIKEQ